jgi:thiol-disulfide isomerase/thioredoxin
MIVTIIILILLFGFFINKSLNKPKKSKSESKSIDMYYFYTAWCPYCKKSFVEWNKFKAEWNKKVYNGYTIYFHEVDCDIEEALASKYKVTQYPTILMIKDNTIINYDAKPEISSLTIFLTS